MMDLTPGVDVVALVDRVDQDDAVVVVWEDVSISSVMNKKVKKTIH